MELLFDIAVTMLFDLAELTGLTYQQVNVVIFIVAWPLLTIWLVWLLEKRRKRIVCLERKVKELKIHARV